MVKHSAFLGARESPLPHPYLSGNFAPIQRTRDLTPCSFNGEIPSDLAGGQYVRNGGNPLANDDLGRDAHWFDGDGMLTGVLFRRITKEGRSVIQPQFVNQYLITDVYSYAKTSTNIERPVVPSIATLADPRTSVLRILAVVWRTITLVLMSWLSGCSTPIKKISVANTSVVYHSGRALATCESGPPLRVALPSLRTVGWFDGVACENEVGKKTFRPGFGGHGVVAFMREWTTAHPKVDASTNELLAFHSGFIKPYVRYSIVQGSPVAGKRSSMFDAAIPGVRSPKLMHDFGVSRHFTVILDLPLQLDPSNIIDGSPVLSYDSTGRSRFGVFPRYHPEAIRWFETNPCCIFHTANCWDTSDETGCVASVNLLACRLTSASVVFSAGNLPPLNLRSVPPEYSEEEQCRLYYYSFSISSSATRCNIQHQWALSAISFDFPVVSPLKSMEKAKYIYGCTTKSSSYTAALGKAVKIDYLAKIDVETLIDRGLRESPQPIKGCVDVRSVDEIQASTDANDPIKLFRMPPGWFAQEPRFVPRAHPRFEDDGWLLMYVFDESQLAEDGSCRDDATSELWIIDAVDMVDVVARVRLPQRVPYGLHGNWFSEADIECQRPFERVREEPSEGRSSSLWWKNIIERAVECAIR